MDEAVVVGQFGGERRLGGLDEQDRVGAGFEAVEQPALLAGLGPSWWGSSRIMVRCRGRSRRGRGARAGAGLRMMRVRVADTAAPAGGRSRRRSMGTARRRGRRAACGWCAIRCAGGGRGGGGGSRRGRRPVRWRWRAWVRGGGLFPDEVDVDAVGDGRVVEAERGVVEEFVDGVGAVGAQEQGSSGTQARRPRLRA
ncbi:hypothetical protein ATKI12_8906 [Kitasatospora sp. Ki12]